MLKTVIGYNILKRENWRLVRANLAPAELASEPNP
jgi:hypothetical protein